MSIWNTQGWLLLLWLAALASSGCGLGTEIGNGFKPERDGSDGDDGQQAAKEDADPMQAPEGDNSEGSGPDGEVAADADSPSPGFAVDLITAECASPFALPLETATNLVRTGSGETVATIDFDADEDVWIIGNASGEPVRHVRATEGDDSTVETTTPAGDAVAQRFECVSKATSDMTYDQDHPAESYEGTTTTVVLRDAEGTEWTVRWDALHPTGEPETPLSLTVFITAPGGTAKKYLAMPR